MPEDEWGRRRHGRRWGPPDGRRPPWWPEGEAWPPADGEPWRRMRRRFFARFLLAAVLFVVVVGSLVAIVSWLVGRALHGPPAFVITALAPFVAIILVVALVARLVRRTGAPVADLVEAAGRIERGELSTRLPERGPAELRTVARAFNAMSSRLEATDDARRRLLADVSHELRTPLTVMQGTLEAVLDGVYPADAAHLAPVLEDTRLLARLIEDLRTLSLTEAGNLRLHLEPTDVADLLGEVVSSHRAAADEAAVSLALRVADELPMVEVDPARIRQVVANLVGNALRLTPAGGSVTLAASLAAAELTVSVRDTGPGMDAETAEHAFDRFYRSPGSPGSGLGLAIARNLVEAHGGHIEIDSTPGSGTEVRFTIPLPFVAGTSSR